MNTILKYAGAATLTAALALAAVTPGQARDGCNAAAAIGFGAGAIIGAAAASSYNSGYYGGGYGYADGYSYGPGYAYEPTPVYAAPAYEDDYAYAPAPRYRSRTGGANYGGCSQSPGSQNYTPC